MENSCVKSKGHIQVHGPFGLVAKVSKDLCNNMANIQKSPVDDM